MTKSCILKKEILLFHSSQFQKMTFSSEILICLEVLFPMFMLNDSVLSMFSVL